MLGPGSTIHGRKYEWINPDEEFAELDDEFIRRNFEEKEKPELSKKANAIPLCEPDTPDILEAVAKYIKDEAPHAYQGHRDDTAFKVACQVKNYGASPSTALDALLDWNFEKCEPPLDEDVIQEKVYSAYKNSQRPQGDDAPAVRLERAREEFDAVDIPDELAWLKPQPVQELDPANIPDREWIVRDLLVRENVTIVVAPSAAGKTQFLAGVALAVASGRPEPIGLEIVERTRVWCWNQEDPLMELNRRIASARLDAGLSWSSIRKEGEQMLFVNSGVDKPLKLAKRLQAGHLAASRELCRIIQHIKDNDIGLFIIDPLVEFHDGVENANEDMHAVIAMARQIAVEAKCAVLIAAHTKKPPQADADA